MVLHLTPFSIDLLMHSADICILSASAFLFTLPTIWIFPFPCTQHLSISLRIWNASSMTFIATTWVSFWVVMPTKASLNYFFLYSLQCRSETVSPVSMASSIPLTVCSAVFNSPNSPLVTVSLSLSSFPTVFKCGSFFMDFILSGCHPPLLCHLPLIHPCPNDCHVVMV